MGAWLSLAWGDWLVMGLSSWLATAIGSGMLAPPAVEGMPAYAVGPSKPYIWLCVIGFATSNMVYKVATSQNCWFSSMATSTSLC